MPKTKNQLINHFLSKNIQVRSVWYPNHMQKPFLNNQSFQVNNSFKIFNKSLCLLSSHSLTKKQLIFIVSTIKNMQKNNYIIKNLNTISQALKRWKNMVFEHY